MNLSFVSAIGLVLTGLGVLGFAVAYMIKNSRLGADAVEDRVLNAQKALVETLQTQLNTESAERQKLQIVVQEMKQEIGRLTGKLDAYQELIRNPDGLTDILSRLLSVTEKIEKYFSTLQPTTVVNVDKK